jgi:hypothetical protein
MGLPVHSEPSRGQVKLPQGRCRSYCVSKACAGGSSLCPTSPSHWSTQHPSRAQLFRRGGSHPPRTFAGGASNANFNHHLGASNLALLLGGVVTYARLKDTTYSLPVLYRFFTPPLASISKLPALAGRYFGISFWYYCACIFLPILWFSLDST